MRRQLVRILVANESAGALALIVGLLQGCGYSGVDSDPMEPPPAPTPYVVTYDYRILDPMSQAVYASGCTAQESAYAGSLEKITATLPLGVEYEVDYVVQRAVGTLSGAMDESYYCGLSQKESAAHVAPSCFESIANSGDELISVTIVDKDGQSKQVATAAYSVSGAPGDVEKYRLISRESGPVAVYCRRGPCGGTESGCVLLTVIAE